MTEGAKGRQRTVSSQPLCTVAIWTAVIVLLLYYLYANTSDSYQPLSEYHSLLTVAFVIMPYHYHIFISWVLSLHSSSLKDIDLIRIFG